MSENSDAQVQHRSSIAVWVTLAIAAVLILGWQIFWRPKLLLDQAIRQPGSGQPLPFLELEPLTGTTEGISLSSTRGKVVLLNFWGTWCPPCLEEFPHMVDIWEEFRGNPDFVFLSVSSTSADREPVAALRQETGAFLRSRGVSMPTYFDAEGASRQAVGLVIGKPAIGYPTTLLLDRGGIIRAVWPGYFPGAERQMQQLVSQLLAEKPN
jgi:thiol-disulfide isomerase/thioredoxin